MGWDTLIRTHVGHDDDGTDRHQSNPYDTHTGKKAKKSAEEKAAEKALKKAKVRSYVIQHTHSLSLSHTRLDADDVHSDIQLYVSDTHTHIHTHTSIRRRSCRAARSRPPPRRPWSGSGPS